MLYRNKNTGVVIQVNSEISGGGWEPVSGTETEKPKTKSPNKPKKTTGKGKK